MYLLIPILTALVLLAILSLVIARALTYVRQHPELLTHGTPPAYQRCQNTLLQVIERYKEIAGQVAPNVTINWQAPNGARYAVSDLGVEERREAAPYFLRWSDIGGVGVRMQPGFRLVDTNRDGSPDNQYTTGYSFYLLIVPITGPTMNVFIPTDGRDDAVDFAAHTIVLAEGRQKRINVFGFDRPPAPHRQRVPRI